MENLITASKSVNALMEEFRSGDIAIPEIQRDVVWSADQVKNLIDSISRGYPCGAMILWEPREKDKQLVKGMIRPERLERYEGRLPRYFLLDGQQRITALASVLLKRDDVRELLAEIEEEMPLVFANVKRFPRDLEATTDPVGYVFPWILFNKLFDGSFRTEPGFSELGSDMNDKLQQFVQRLRDYQFPVQIISGRDYGSVAEIFTRVNSAGTQLTGAEIHLARIVPHWRGITSEFRQYRKELGQRSFDLDLTFLMRSITVVECNVPQIKKLADRIAKDHLTRKHLNKTWRQARAAIDRMIKLLRNGLNLDKSKFFTSKNAMVPLVYALATANGSKRLERNVIRFFLLSQLSQWYSGSAETTLRKDFRTLADAAASPQEGLADLVGEVNREARRYYRGLRIKPDNIKGLPSRNVFVLLMYILMRNRNATDWGTGNPMSLGQIEPRRLQLHHIFPFDYMNKNKMLLKAYLDDGLTPADFRADINDIANLTFLSRETNIGLGDTPPSQYLPNDTTRETRKAHFIPEDPHVWKTENFREFLQQRRELLAQAMTSMLRHL